MGLIAMMGKQVAAMLIVLFVGAWGTIWLCTHQGARVDIKIPSWLSIVVEPLAVPNGLGVEKVEIKKNRAPEKTAAQ